MGIVARQATLNTLLAYLGIGLGFVNVVLLYPKVLDSDQFGLTRLLVSITTIAAQIAQLGAENTVIRYFPYFRDPAKDHRGLLGMLLLFGTAIDLLTMLVLSPRSSRTATPFSARTAGYCFRWCSLRSTSSCCAATAAPCSARCSRASSGNSSCASCRPP